MNRIHRFGGLFNKSKSCPNRRFLISGTAAAASGTLTVQRTISEPASASSSVCFSVDSTSAVSVLVMDWTTMGAPPPTRTWPTFTQWVLRRAWRVPVASNPAICVSEDMVTNSLAAACVGRPVEAR